MEKADCTREEGEGREESRSYRKYMFTSLVGDTTPWGKNFLF